MCNLVILYILKELLEMKLTHYEYRNAELASHDNAEELTICMV